MHARVDVVAPAPVLSRRFYLKAIAYSADNLKIGPGIGHGETLRMRPEDVRAIVEMEVREPTWEQEARALQLCIRHLIADAEALRLPHVGSALQRAVAGIESAIATEHGGA